MSASGADVPQIEDLSGTTTVTAVAGYADQDPVELVRAEIHAEFEETIYADAAKNIVESNGVVTIFMDNPAKTLSSAETYLRFCKAAADVIETPERPSSVKAVAVAQLDGRTIAAATAESPACFYR